jgi:hypothetical protein
LPERRSRHEQFSDSRPVATIERFDGHLGVGHRPDELAFRVDPI